MERERNADWRLTNNHDQSENQNRTGIAGVSPASLATAANPDAIRAVAGYSGDRAIARFCALYVVPLHGMSTFLKTLCDGSEIKPVFNTTDDCYQQGQAAASQGFRRLDNPYPVGTIPREWWDGGYLNETDELLGT